MNHFSIGDFGIFNGSVGSGHDLGGGFPYFLHVGQSDAALLTQIPAPKLYYEFIHLVRTHNFQKD